MRQMTLFIAAALLRSCRATDPRCGLLLLRWSDFHSQAGPLNRVVVELAPAPSEISERCDEDLTGCANQAAADSYGKGPLEGP
jgi:hypothetical protein